MLGNYLSVYGSPCDFLEDASSLMPWFCSPMYSRYWQHYHQALAWQQRHRRAYMMAVQAAFSAPYCHPHYQSSHQRDVDWQAENGDCYQGEDGDDDDDDNEEEEDDDDVSSESEIECDVTNMEISEELRQYFAHTEKHRAELKRQQQLEAEQQDSYVLADQDLHASSWTTSGAPPAERPGERRRAEMKKLYGEDAAKILAMEAAMQLSFDRNCDCKQPKYWPVIPLKL
ncbi:gem-associated protein 8 isoform 1-T1 [Synchiropus picturatus]